MKRQFVRCLGIALLLPVISISASTAPQVLQYLQEGSAHYLKHEYKEAIGLYAKALELEKKQPTLDSTLWRVLIDNLGMAYGISGDLKSAKETFEYGLSKDKTYPMFYYNLACTYAEMNDMDASIANLKLAFSYKANVIATEQMPDPATDDSFQRFLKNERFVGALREINRPSIMAAAAEPDRIVVTEKANEFEMAVPVSRLVMKVPKAGFQQASTPRAEATASKRYFYLEDAARHIILSGWFESQNGFEGMTKFWEGETSAWARNNLPKPDHVVFKKIGGWDAITYDMPRPSGSNAHIRAEWTAAGTWIDLHLSIVSTSPLTESQNSLESLLAGIKVTEK